jgi:hypothetical protein
MRPSGLIFGSVLAALLVAACSSIPRHAAPADLALAAEVPGFEDIRYRPLLNPEPVRAMLRQAFFDETEASYVTEADGSRHYYYLSISGGGSDGAFGAGLLNGWSSTGGRPNFKVVTGVSTGALIAPFAFLGPDYDDELKASYTEVDATRIFVARSLLSMLWSESLTDTTPLRALVASYIDEEVLDRIAEEHAKGRRLLVASTNLDAEEPVIWDLGAIAGSKSPDRLELFRKVLVASASIPTVFPPTMLSVKIGDRTYDEMHVDGGVFFQSFFFGSMINLPATISAAHPDFKDGIKQSLYVIRNGRITPAPKVTERGLTAITLRAIGTMLKMSAINDLYRLYLATLHDDVEFRFIAIPQQFVSETEEQFNEAEMNRQYAFGEKMGREGIPWMSVPPVYQMHADEDE